MVSLPEEDDSIRFKRTLEHLKEGYFVPFMASLENIEFYIAQCGMVLVTDILTKHVWGFKMSVIENMSNLELRTFLRDFLLVETWEKCTQSKYFITKTTDMENQNQNQT